MDLDYVFLCCTHTPTSRNADGSRMSGDDLWIGGIRVVDNAVLLQFSILESLPVLSLIETASHFLYANPRVRHG